MGSVNRLPQLGLLATKETEHFQTPEAPPLLFIHQSSLKRGTAALVLFNRLTIKRA